MGCNHQTNRLVWLTNSCSRVQNYQLGNWSPVIRSLQTEWCQCLTVKSVQNLYNKRNDCSLYCPPPPHPTPQIPHKPHPIINCAVLLTTDSQHHTNNIHWQSVQMALSTDHCKQCHTNNIYVCNGTTNWSHQYYYYHTESITLMSTDEVCEQWQ